MLLIAATPPREAAHHRFVTPHGSVHVWQPQGYDAETAELVVYVHGYYVDADGAWTEHRLADQFAASGRNALFVVPEAPAGDDQGVAWPRLDALLAAVRAEGIAVPKGPAAAVAHSGGYRTVLPWLRGDAIDAVVLVDGMYGGEAQLKAWLAEDDARRLVFASSTTAERTRQFVEGAGDAVRDQIVVVPTQAGHMELITDGRALPSLIQSIW